MTFNLTEWGSERVILDLVVLILGFCWIGFWVKKKECTNRQLETIISSIEDAIIITSIDGIIKSWNKGAQQNYGYSATETIGQSIYLIIPENRQKEFNQVVIKLKAGESVERHDTFRKHKNGTLIPVSRTAAAIKNKRGNIIGILLISHNINGIKLSEERFRRIIEAAPDAMIMINQEGKIIFVNNQTETIFGYRKEELIGQFVEKLIPERYRMKHPEHRLKYFSSSHVRPMGAGMVLYGERKNGDEFPVEISLSPFEIREETVALAAVRDVTERNKVEQLKNDFISMVSHELRTPLTSIQGSLSLLMGKCDTELSDKSRQLLSIAKLNSERLIRLINDILDIEKNEYGKFGFELKPFTPDLILEEAVKLSQDYGIQLGVTIKLQLPIPTALIYIDKDRVVQVLLNLVSNAIKFSPPGAEVTIAAQKKNKHIRISVTDRGAGVPEEFKNKIFEKFAQADSSSSRLYGGTGLGLSISKAIIEGHGGVIDYISQKNGDTTFYFDLPLTKQKE